jgi:hypothetical protein
MTLSKLPSEPKQQFVFPFIREHDRWYIDYPEFIQNGYGSKADLEMIAGADVLLSELSQGQDCIRVEFANFELQTADVQLWKIDQDEIGATYQTNHYATETAWLCNVTKAVFAGFHPKQIWLNRVA